MLRRLIIACILLAVAAALGWAFWPRPVIVELASIARRNIVLMVEEEGKARIREVYTVSAPITGQTLRIDLHAGDMVEKGQTVVSLRPAAPGLLDARLRRVAEAAAAAASAAVDLATSEVRQASAELTFLRTELARTEQLAAQGNISESARNKARLAVETGAAALDSANALLGVRQRELDRAQAALIETGNSEGPCCTDLKAPVSGRILRVLAESEQVVQPGTALIQIGDPADLEIAADILSREAVEIRPGAEAVIDGWGGPPLPARVTRVEPSATTKVSALGIEEQRVAVILELIGPDVPAGLGDGFRVIVRVTVWQGNDVIAVPVAALFRDGWDWAVYRADNGRARLQHLVLGRRNDDFAEVTSGLDVNDSVVLHPSDQLSDGAMISAAAR